jgi:hypothetical protein
MRGLRWLCRAAARAPRRKPGPSRGSRALRRRPSMVSRIVSHSKITKVRPTPSRPAVQPRQLGRTPRHQSGRAAVPVSGRYADLINRQFSSSAAQALTPAAALTEAYAAGMPDRTRAARVGDVHRLAMEMPHVTVTGGTKENPVYQVGGKSFIFFRNPRPDAVDPDSGERYRDVIVFWVADEAEKQALVQDESTPFFSTSHFDGHLSVLVRASRLDELSLAELQEIVQDAWLARASRHRAEQWLSSHPASGMPSAG